MFTSNQIEEIRKKLQLGGTKDTQFPLADSLKGNETVAIIQQGINKQLSIKAFIESVTRWSISDFLNISKSSEDSYTLEEVLKIITPINRKAGQVITFKNKKTGDWSIYQFKGESAEDWFNMEYWDDILAKADNHFKGLILNDCILEETYPKPMVGDFAFVGSTLEEAVIYICYNYGHWHNTEEPALAYMNGEIKSIIESIFNNLEDYPELLEILKNNAVSGSGGIYTLNISEYKGEQFSELKEAINNKKVIVGYNFPGLILNTPYSNIAQVIGSNTLEVRLSFKTYPGSVLNSNNGPDHPLFEDVYIFTESGVTVMQHRSMLKRTGNGTKFLADDGIYKEIISKTSNICNIDYSTYSSSDFSKIKSTIDSGGIITVSNTGIEGLSNYNVYNVYYNSDTQIILYTIVQPTITVGSGSAGTSYGIVAAKIGFNSNGTKSTNKTTFDFTQGGSGTRFLADNGKYIETRTKIDISGVIFTALGSMEGDETYISDIIYNDIIREGGKTLFTYHVIDRSTMTEFGSAGVPYCMYVNTDGTYINFTCPFPDGIKIIKCNITQTKISFNSIIEN